MKYFISGIIFFILVSVGTIGVHAGVDKIVWCHTEPNGNSQTLELPIQALQNAGHVNAQGNPLHAGDHPGACEEVSPTVSPTTDPTVSPTVSPTIEVSPTVPTEEVTPTLTPDPTATPTGTLQTNTQSDGKTDGKSDGHVSTPQPTYGCPPGQCIDK